jgi:hypothetical protein
VESDESEGEEEERETEEEGQTVAEHVMPPAVLNSTVDRDEVPTVATLCDNNTEEEAGDGGAKKVQEEEVEVEKAAGEEKQENVPENCADEAEAELTSPGQCCESRSGAFLTLDPGSGIGFFRIRNRFLSNPGSQTHIFDSLTTNFGQKFLLIWLINFLYLFENKIIYGTIL